MRPERVLPQHLILLKIGSTPPALRGTYTIAKPPRLARATRGLSHDHDDGVEVVSRRRHRPDVKFKFIFCPESDLVVGERVPVLLKQRVDAGDAPVPGVLEVLERQSPILGVGLLALEPVLIDTVSSRTQRRRLSDGRVDGAAVALSHEDAIDATSQVQVQNLR